MKKYNLIFVLLLVLANNTQAQIITTIAGNGIETFAGDGGPAVASSLNTPNDVAVGADGSIFVVDAGNERIRKIDPSGIITTIAGTGVPGYTGDGGPATAATFNLPVAIILDPMGNIYISDNDNFAIRKIDTNGIISTFAGGGGNEMADGVPATTAALSYPVGMTIDKARNIYIANYNLNLIQRVDTAGIIHIVAGNSIADFSGDGGPATNAELKNPTDVAIDNSGNIYIADQGNYRIRKVDTSGIITTYAGNAIYGDAGDGGPATAAWLKEPYYIHEDTLGNLYICDDASDVIRVVNSSGIITTFAGTGGFGFYGDGGPAIDAELFSPAGLAFDHSGNLLIADATNMRIRKIGTPTLAAASVHDPGNIINIAPNPAVSMLMITATIPLTSVAVYNVMGQIMLYQDLASTATQCQLDVSDYTPGIYFVKINNDKVRQFVKE